LFTDISSQMVFPLIPLFLVSVLGAGAYTVGIVEGAAETTVFFIQSCFWLLNLIKLKKKAFCFVWYSLSSITKPLFAFANVWHSVLFIRVIERIGKGIRDAPRDAIVAESTSKNVRGKAYGFERAMDGIGSVIGAILAFLLLPILGYKNIFLFAFYSWTDCCVLLFYLSRKKMLLLKKKQKNTSLKVSFKELSWNLKLFIIVSSIFAIGHFGYAFLLLRAKDIGLTDQASLLLYVLFYLVYVIFTIPSGILSDKIGRKPILMISYALFAITSFGLIFTSSIYSILLFFIIYGIFYAMIDGAQRAFVVDLAPKHLKATALGTFHATIGLVALPGGFIAGLLWDKINPQATFIYGFVLTIISLILFTFVKEKQKEHKNFNSIEPDI